MSLAKKKKENLGFCQRKRLIFLRQDGHIKFSATTSSFTREYYDLWAIKMETMLKVNDVWDHVKFGFAKPQNDA